MRFLMPKFPCDFEIPDDWLSEAAALGFTPTASTYRSSPDGLIVPCGR